MKTEKGTIYCGSTRWFKGTRFGIFGGAEAAVVADVGIVEWAVADWRASDSAIGPDAQKNAWLCFRLRCK